jgi:hypothetical protein
MYIVYRISLSSSENKKCFRYNFTLYVLYLFPQNNAVHEIMRKNTRRATDNNIIPRMRFATWTNEATDTESEYVVLIAFPPQQWLRDRARVTLLVNCLSH